MEWECERCTLRNEADALKCLACEADRPDFNGLPPMGSLEALSPQSPDGHFLPPTAGCGGGSSVLPPTGTLDFGSGNRPPQGSYSPNALADMMPSPPARHLPPGRTPHDAGHGTLDAASDMFGAMESYDRGGGYDTVKDTKGKKQKKSKKEKDQKDPSRDEIAMQDAPPARQYQDRQYQDRRVPPESPDMEDNIPTYAPAGAHSGTAFQGDLAGGRVLLRILRAYDLRNTDLGILPSDASDPFAVARIGSKDYKTHVVENSLSPVWDSQRFEFPLGDDVDPILRIEVFSSNQWHANDSLGQLDVPIRSLVPGEVHTATSMLHEEVPREDGKRARIQIKVQLQCREPYGGPRQQKTTNFGALDRKKKENMVPLPSFKGLGPEAVARPLQQVKLAETGEARRVNEYESLACHLGQYDYSGPPPYYPRQQVIDKRQWKDDPFSEWRRELNRAEHRAPAAEDQGSDAWKNDPFHWMRQRHLSQEGAENSEGNIELLQEAKVARHLMSLPSFSEAPVRRFNDHREYVDHRRDQQDRTAYSTGYQDERSLERPRSESGVERWKDDAFFGWLPGRGEEPEMARLRRPLQQARLARLPSFAEGSKELAGVTGRGIGILTLWVNGASRLAYSVGSGLHGKPSPAVKVRIRSDQRQAARQEKITATIPRESNPKWNSPPMTFEVNSRMDFLQLEVLDWANPRGEEHINQHFLGRSQKHLEQIIEALHRSKNPTKPLPFREVLEGSPNQAVIDFDCLYESYDEEAHSPGWRKREPSTQEQQLSWQSLPKRSTYRSGDSRDRDGHGHGHGVLSVRVIAAYDLMNTDTGFFGDVSDPYVTVRLESQSEKQQKRTHTINNDLNPRWNSSPFLFPVEMAEDQLLLEVWDEDMMQAADFLGRMKIPLYKIIHGRVQQPILIRERLQDTQSGELEVEIGFSPG